MSVLSSVTTHRELVGNLVARDVKARYKQSVLGYAWAVFNPLATALIMALVGGLLLGQGKGPFPFVLHAYFGLLIWNIFATGWNAATEGLVAHIGLLTKVYFPREVFPVAAVLSKLVDFGFGLVGLLPFLILYRDHVSLGWTVLLVPVFVVILLLFTTGLGMLTACANLFYRDVRYLVGIVLSLWMYLVPNLYTLEKVKEHAGIYQLYLLNPVAAIVEASRRATFPQTGSLVSLVPYLLSALCVSVAVFAVGFVVFKRYEPRFAESV